MPNSISIKLKKEPKYSLVKLLRQLERLHTYVVMTVDSYTV